jgi:hypothetical protein
MQGHMQKPVKEVTYAGNYGVGCYPFNEGLAALAISHWFFPYMIKYAHKRIADQGNNRLERGWRGYRGIPATAPDSSFRGLVLRTQMR